MRDFPVLDFEKGLYSPYFSSKFNWEIKSCYVDLRVTKDVLGGFDFSDQSHPLTTAKMRDFEWGFLYF